MATFTRDHYIGPEDYPLLAEVRIAGDWQQALRARFADYGVTLTDNGLIADKVEVFGAYELLDVEEARARYGAARWMQAPSPPCPFLEPVAGYLRFSFDLIRDYEAHPIRHEAALCLVREARGRIVRLPDDRWCEAVVERPLHLGGLVSKFGFEDGDALLTRAPGPYARYVVAAVERALADAGLAAWVGWRDGTCHNPVRLATIEHGGQQVFALWPADRRDRDPWEQPDAAPIADPEARLAGLTAPLWAFEFAALGDLDWWRAL
ncbi:MAG: hypothetical protein KC636_31140 [Myxococcales bacterium]|nr:hypothetical protein [Myxococcales bacterium]